MAIANRNRPVKETIFDSAATLQDLLAAGQEYVSKNVAFAKSRRDVSADKYYRRAIKRTVAGYELLLGNPMAAKKVKQADTLQQVWGEVQKIGLQISGLQQNVNAVGSNTNTAAKQVAAAASATGAAAGGASTILFVAAAGLLLFWFWKR